MADVEKERTDVCDNNGDLTRFKVVDLKKYLANRNLNVSGLKCDLINRVTGAHKLDITDRHSLEKADLIEQSRRHTQRYILPCWKAVIPPTALEIWTDNIELFPVVEEKDIYNYIVLKKHSKCQLKSRVFYDDGHVQNIEINIICGDSSHSYARSSVLPSFPTADKRKSPEYQPWVLVSKVTDCIHSAFCNCPAGEGECCNHIGALLYGLQDLSEKKSLAPTSKPCAWSNYSMLSVPRKRKLSPRKSENLVYEKKKVFTLSTRKLTINKDNEQNKSNSCTVNVDRFKQRLLKANVNAGWLKNFARDRAEEHALPVLNTIEFNYCDSVNLNNESCRSVFSNHFDRLHQNKEDIQLTEILTRGQTSETLKEARRERLTSSCFGAVYRRKADTPPEPVLNQMMYSSFRSKYTDYGRKHEKVAKKVYVLSMQKNHKGLSVKDCGFYVDPQRPHLGTSPDGLV